MFGNARLKLTAIYTAIIAAISILFSVAIALTASNEISRPINQPKEFVIGYSQNIEDLFQSRAAEAEGRVIAVLIVANIIIIAAGATSSYFLARWTLKPIEEAMENQARFVSDASHELKTPLAAIIMENEVKFPESSFIIMISPSLDDMTAASGPEKSTPKIFMISNDMLYS